MGTGKPLREEAAWRRVPGPNRVFQGEPADLRSLAGIVADTLALRPQGIIQFGLLFLIATPICRVAVAFVAFAWQRDRVYILITFIVLGVLVFSLTAGGR